MADKKTVESGPGPVAGESNARAVRNAQAKAEKVPEPATTHAADDADEAKSTRRTIGKHKS